ncbi:MAG: type II secretion system minor pseudopilin GspI [Gammaproteobacteria bacterium]
MNSRRARGFTLLEVMVALAIVSIGLIAVFNGIIQMAHSTSTLRERALADWIAMNMISQIRISGDFPDVGRFDGSTEFAGREWRWEADISETGVTDLRRIDMSVAYEDLPDDVITIMAGFVSRRAEVAPARIDWWGAGTLPADGENDGEDQPDSPNRPDAGEEEEDEE